MSASDLDRRLTSFFDAASSEALPDNLLDDVYRVTRRIPQQRGPLARRVARVQLWWSAPFGIAPRLRTLAVAALLIALLTASVLYVAGHYKRLPPPYGPAEDGLIVFDINQHLYIAQPDGLAVPLDIGLGVSSNPSYSPDGTHLAFWSRATADRPASLFVADADGGNARNITGDMPILGDKLASIAWSPDSRRIAFASRVKRSPSGLFVAAADGSGVVQITPADDVDRANPAWSPRGDLIAFQHFEDGKAGLAVIKPDGSGEDVLIEDNTGEGWAFAWPQWSPDGTKLAYQHDDGGQEMIGVIGLDKVEIPLNEIEPGEAPVWSNDGTRLAFFQVFTLRVVVRNLVTGERTSIPPGVGDFGVYWSPDDQTLLGIGEGGTAYRIPLDHPEAAVRLSEVQGDLHMFTQQRLAP